MEQKEASAPSRRTPKINLMEIRASMWVIVGYAFWVGFFIGAMIMHSLVK